MQKRNIFSETSPTIARMLWFCRRYSMAENILRRSTGSGNTSAAFELTRLLVDDSRRGDAISILRGNLAGRAPGAALWLADLLAEDSDTGEEAEYWYKVAIEEGDLDSPNEYGTFLSDNPARINEARAMYQLAISNGDSLAVGNMGRLEFDEENFNEAIHFFEKAISLGVLSVLPMLARAEVKTGRADDAWRHMQAAVDAQINGAFVAKAEVLIAYAPAEFEEIEANLKQAVENLEDGSMFLAARWLHDQRRLDDAIEMYELAANHGETNAYMNLGVIYERLDDHVRATASYRAGMTAGDFDCAINFAEYLAANRYADEYAQGVELLQLAPFSDGMHREIRRLLDGQD